MHGHSSITWSKWDTAANLIRGAGPDVRIIKAIHRRYDPDREDCLLEVDLDNPANRLSDLLPELRSGVKVERQQVLDATIERVEQEAHELAQSEARAAIRVRLYRDGGVGAGSATFRVENPSMVDNVDVFQFSTVEDDLMPSDHDDLDPDDPSLGIGREVRTILRNNAQSTRVLLGLCLTFTRDSVGVMRGLTSQLSRELEASRSANQKVLETLLTERESRQATVAKARQEADKAKLTEQTTERVVTSLERMVTQYMTVKLAGGEGGLPPEMAELVSKLAQDPELMNLVADPSVLAAIQNPEIRPAFFEAVQGLRAMSQPDNAAPSPSDATA